MEFNDTTLNEFRKEFKDAVKSIEKEHGITINLGRITYFHNHFDAKLTVTNGEDPDIVAEHNFDDKVWKYEEYGLKKGMYRQIFIGTDGARYYIEGFRDNARKYPISMVRISDGEHRVCKPEFIREFLNEKFYESQ